MNTELKEKIQKAAERLCITDAYGKCKFMQGAATMYTELAPLVEWVSVEDNPLPSDIEDFFNKA